MQPTSIHAGLSTELANEVEVFPGVHERRFFLVGHWQPLPLSWFLKERRKEFSARRRSRQ